ncbi:MAG: hypothetical protein LC720_06230, partial [Actinobacteria bacterium]|nr:hypothetical protein [Actinomycetota bacterium]
VNLGVASANVHALAGFYFGIDATGATFGAFLRIGGSVDLLGVVSISIELYLGLQYSTDHGTIAGTASLTVSVHVLFTDVSVSLMVHKEFHLAGPSGKAASGPQARAALAAVAAPPVTFDQTMSPSDWGHYCAAFASETPR